MTVVFAGLLAAVAAVLVGVGLALMFVPLGFIWAGLVAAWVARQMIPPTEEA